MNDQSESLCFMIKALANQIRRLFDAGELHEDMGAMTGIQYGVISYVADSEQDVFQRDLELKFNIRRSTATGILQLMEKNGLIRREPVEHDARLKKIVLTDKSTHTCQQGKDRISAVEQKLTEGLTEEEIASLSDILGKMIHNLEC